MPDPRPVLDYESPLPPAPAAVPPRPVPSPSAARVAKAWLVIAGLVLAAVGVVRTIGVWWTLMSVLVVLSVGTATRPRHDGSEDERPG